MAGGHADDDAPRFEVRGALLRGLVDHMVRRDSIETVEATLATADLAPREILPRTWYPLHVFDTLVRNWAEDVGEDPKQVAYRAGQRLTAHGLEDVEEDLCQVPVPDLVARLETLFRGRTDPPVRTHVVGGDVHVLQDPPGGDIVCPLFHGMIDALIQLLRAEGCLGSGAAVATGCSSQGDAHCSYRLTMEA